MALTAKQQAYVQARIEGLGPSDAYRRAYDAENMLPVTVNKRAHELEKHGEIAGMVTGIQQQAIIRLQVTAEDIVRRAWEIAQEDKPDRVQALNLLAKRHPEFREKGADEPDKHLHVHVMGQLSVDDLRRLASGDAQS